MPSWQMRAVGLLIRATRGRNYRTEAAGRALLERDKGPSAPPESLRDRCRVHVDQLDGFDVYGVTPLAAGEGTEQRPVVVYVHGGGYVNEIVAQHWDLVADLAVGTGCAVHVPVYGLAPQHNAETALRLVTRLIRDLADQGRLVHLVGDSAGGGLALAAAQALLGSPPAVGSLTLLSPWLDLTMANPDIAPVEATDPWLSRDGLRPVAAAWADGLPLDDPRVSPLYGTSKGLPRLSIWVGTRDITLPDCRLLWSRLGDDVADQYHEEPGALHVYPLLPVPEGRAAREAIVEHVKRQLHAPV